MMKYILLLCLTLAFAGCNTPSSNIKFSGIEPASTDTALIYIYRPHHHYGDLNWPNYHVGNDHFVMLGDSTFTIFRLPAGRYLFKPDKKSFLSGDWGPSAEFTFEAGKSYFIRFGILGEFRAALTLNGAGGYTYNSNGSELPFMSMPVTQEQAMNEMKLLNYVSPDTKDPK